MIFYASKNHDRLNGKEYNVECVTETLCVNPKYPITISNPATKYIVDSGAFQDVKSENRLTFMGALERQLGMIAKIGFDPEAIVSYDRLVDEQLRDDKQIKERVSESVGWEYVDETINAAKFLSDNRQRVNSKLILSCQGTTIEQYDYCVEEVLKHADKGDWIELGGFCIIYQKKEYKEQYREIVKKVLPTISKKCNRIHVFGMSIFKELHFTETIANKYNVDVSYDTSSAEFNGIMGRVFNPLTETICQVYDRQDKYVYYHPCNIALMNVELIKNYWELNDKYKGGRE